MRRKITLEALDRRIDALARMTQKEFTAMRAEMITKKYLEVRFAEFVTKDYLRDALNDTVAAIEALLDHKLERVEQALKLERRLARVERQLGIES